MRAGYLSGAPGILASSLAWAAAAGTAFFISSQQAIWVLFIGGMLIHPASLLIGKMLGASVTHTRGNPLAQLVGANTIWMIVCLPLAYIASMQMIEWFFPAMLLIIGGRYLTFGTLYGMRFYWVLGVALISTGFGLGVLALAPAVSAGIGAAIEFMFAIVAFTLHSRWAKQSS